MSAMISGRTTLTMTAMASVQNVFPQLILASTVLNHLPTCGCKRATFTITPTAALALGLTVDIAESVAIVDNALGRKTLFYQGLPGSDSIFLGNPTQNSTIEKKISGDAVGVIVAVNPADPALPCDVVVAWAFYAD